MASLTRSNRSRGVKNSLAKWLITLGGISVLFTLVLIFLYLLYVVKPIFESAQIEPKVSINLDLKANDKVLSTGVDELQEVAYEITEAGNIDFYHLKTSAPEADNQFAVGDNALSMSLFASDDFNQEQVVNVVNSFSANKLLHTSKGKTLLVQPSFYAKYANDTREIIPQVNYPLGQDSLIIDEQQTTLSQLAFAMDDERIVFVAFTDDKRLIKTSFIAEDDFSSSSDGDDVEYETIFQQIELTNDVIDEIKVTPDLSLAFIRSASTVYVYSLSDDEEVSLKATITPTLDNDDTYLTSMALLSGSSSVLLGDSSGRVSQWFEVATESGRQFKQIRSFNANDGETLHDKSKQASSAISAIYTEQYRKSFYTMTESGMVNVFYTTSSAHLWQGKLASAQPEAFSIAPRANGLIIIGNDPLDASKKSLQTFSVHNEHPEVTWQALWQEVWYEGYAEPDYIWQSTSASDDFEPKLSLVPITFGTIKAAFYAMLMAAPLAILSLIHI